MFLNFMKPMLIVCVFFIQTFIYAEHFEVPYPQSNIWSYVDPRANVKPHDIFREAPALSHIVQTYSLDCPLLAGIASVLNKDPERIRNMIRQNERYTKVTVSLYNRTYPNQINTYEMDTVRDTSTSPSGLRYEMTSSGKIWVHFIERAYKHMLSLDNEKMPTSTSSNALSPVDVLKSLLGQNSEPFFEISPNNINEEQDLELFTLPGAGIVTLKSTTTVRTNVRHNHAYAILGTKDNALQIFNPINEEGWIYTTYPRVVSIPLNELLRDFTVYYTPFDSDNSIAKDYLQRKQEGLGDINRDTIEEI